MKINGKKCIRCGIEKDINNFSKQAKAIDGHYSWCKECAKEYRRHRYYSNLEESRRYNNENRSQRIKWFRGLKNKIPCKDCDIIYDPSCMDYDHVPGRGIKISTISRMVLNNTAIYLIFKEIKKCDLVCLFCHNKRTHDRFGPKTKYSKYRLRNIKIINDFKNKECVICGEKYEHYNMQVDHIDPSTRIDYVCNLKGSKESILRKELDKCQVLCAMCHRKKSLFEQKMGKYRVLREKKLKRKKLFFDSNMNIKECGICHEVKSCDKFGKRNDVISGCNSYCKDCFYIYRRRLKMLKSNQ